MSARWSIRQRVKRGTLGVVLAAWILTIPIAGLFINHEMNEVLDQELQTVAEVSEQFMDDSPGPVIPRTIGLTEASPGRVLRITRPGEVPMDTPWPPIAEDGLHDIAGWKVLRRSTMHGVVEVGHDKAWRRVEVLEALSSLLVLLLPMMATLILALSVILGRALAPIERLARGIAQRQPDDLSPVVAPDLPEEAVPLVTAFNHYIQRIEALRQSERRFIANAAHELRTPLAAIRARLELSADPDARAAVPVLDALTHRVERLLQLSRVEAGVGLGEGPTDLLRVMPLVIGEVGRGAITFDDGDQAQMLVPFDPDALAILLRNLLENAVRHGTGGVFVRLDPQGRLRIENDTDQTAFLDAPFEKGAASGGAGLGLSIVTELARSMGIGLSRQMGGGRAVVTLDLSRRRGEAA